MFILGGSWSGGLGGKIGEIWRWGTGEFSKLPGVPVEPILTDDPQGVYRADNYGWFFSWKNGDGARRTHCAGRRVATTMGQAVLGYIAAADVTRRVCSLPRGPERSHELVQPLQPRGRGQPALGG